MVGEGEACEGDQNAKEQARRREPRWYVRERESVCVCEVRGREHEEREGNGGQSRSRAERGAA